MQPWWSLTQCSAERLQACVVYVHDPCESTHSYFRKPHYLTEALLVNTQGAIVYVDTDVVIPDLEQLVSRAENIAMAGAALCLVAGDRRAPVNAGLVIIPRCARHVHLARQPTAMAGVAKPTSRGELLLSLDFLAPPAAGQEGPRGLERSRQEPRAHRFYPAVWARTVHG